ncbi:MAG: poly-gamma-glutamate system protein [bacterium]|nr:poly-gamma-glutamate system protein [bacterium]
MPWPRLLPPAVAAILAVAGLHLAGARGAWPDAPTLAAMGRFCQAREALWVARDARVDAATRAELAVADPLRTGLVGIEWSPLTTTPGSVAAKRTTAHPLWVAVFRTWYSELGAERSDRVAIGASGSFPGMLLAARIAAESMGLEPIVVGSLTSSNHGANLPAFDLADIERVLLAAGLVDHPMAALTPGGDGDAALDLEPADRDALLDRLEELAREPAAPPVHRPAGRLASIAWREDLFFGSDEIVPGGVKAFVNIGGHAANYGVGAAPLALPPGLIDPRRAAAIFHPDREVIGDSVAIRALRHGLPVINILNVRALAAEHGIPYDPARLPPPLLIRLPRRLCRGWRLAAGVLAVGLSWWFFRWRAPRPGAREWFELCSIKLPH